MLLSTCSVHVFGAQLRAGVGARGAQVNTTACIAHCAQVSVCACVPAVMLIARGYVSLVFACECVHPMVTLVHRFVQTVVVCAGEYERAEVVFTHRCAQVRTRTGASECVQGIILTARECVHAVVVNMQRACSDSHRTRVRACSESSRTSARVRCQPSRATMCACIG